MAWIFKWTKKAYIHRMKEWWNGERKRAWEIKAVIIYIMIIDIAEVNGRPVTWRNDIQKQGISVDAMPFRQRKTEMESLLLVKQHSVYNEFLFLLSCLIRRRTEFLIAPDV